MDRQLLADLITPFEFRLPAEKLHGLLAMEQCLVPLQRRTEVSHFRIARSHQLTAWDIHTRLVRSKVQRYGAKSFRFDRQAASFRSVAGVNVAPQNSLALLGVIDP